MSERSAGALRVDVTTPSGEEREAVVLRATLDGTHVGWGEASPLPGYSPDGLDEVESALDRWARHWESAADSPDEALGAHWSEDPEIASLPSARCAVDTALLDLAARRLGVPLRALLLDAVGPARPFERVPVAGVASLPGVDRAGAPAPTEGPLAEINRFVAEGYRVVKLKIGGADFDAELAELERIREAFPYLTLRLDVNGSWTAEEARRRLATIATRLRIEFVEQPVGAEELLSFGSSPIPLAADESVRLPDALDSLGGPTGCAHVVLKPMLLGGPRACLRLAARGFEDGLRAIASHAFGGAIAHATACELALVLAAADPSPGTPAVGLAGHDELPQRAGPWIVPADVEGHGVESPW